MLAVLALGRPLATGAQRKKRHVTRKTVIALAVRRLARPVLVTGQVSERPGIPGRLWQEILIIGSAAHASNVIGPHVDPVAVSPRLPPTHV
jgi:hypothetical protein